MDPKLQALLEFLKANNASADLIKQVESLKTVSIDSVKEFLEKDEAGKKLLQTQKDAAVTKGIETFKEKTMPGLLEDEIKKKFPDETAEQKRMRELETKQQKLEAEIKRKDLHNKAISLATEKKLPIKLMEKFLGEDEDATLKNIEEFESIYSDAIGLRVEEKFKENGRGGGDGGTALPAKDITKMTDDEYFTLRTKKNN
jgi:hypothetical protein